MKYLMDESTIHPSNGWMEGLFNSLELTSLWHPTPVDNHPPTHTHFWKLCPLLFSTPPGSA